MRDPSRLLARDAPALEVDIVVIGAGQAGLSAAYHLKRLGLAPVAGKVVDRRPRAPLSMMVLHALIDFTLPVLLAMAVR